MDVQACLADRRRYERQIERLHQRYLLSSRLFELKQDDVSLASIVINRGKVARLLAREVSHGRYELEPGELRTIFVGGKKREVFSCRLTDLIVHGVVAGVAQEATAARLSDRVFSYRRGFAWLSPVAQLAAYLRAERRSRDGARPPGVYVLRRDVASYFDSIPIGRDSSLWPALEADLGRPLPELVEGAIRAEMHLPDGGLAVRVKGLPMGQPIAGVLGNLYLTDMDRALERVPGAFYARYGDDFLFAHRDPAVAASADAEIDAHIDRLGLALNEKKRRTLYVTSSGRPAEEWDRAKGAPAVPFLGMRVAADGTVGLDPSPARVLLREIGRRTRATARTLRGADRDEMARTVCSVVNRTLDPRSALTHHQSAVRLRRVVTDRHQLEQLDYRIALMVAEAVSGRSGARAFREVPYRALRQDYGLVSLVAARNARGRGR